MNKIVTIKNNTVDEAVAEALLQLNANKDEVEINVKQESKSGFLDIGAKKAIVEVTLIDNPKIRAEKFLKLMFDKMDIETVYEINMEEDILKIHITKVAEEDKGILIGKRGNTLNEMQFLITLIVNKDREDYIKINLDVEDYRAKREETLKRLAHKTADKCRYYHRKQRLEPMNPYERRIIHSSLQGEKDLITYSEGDEPYRKVVVDLKRKQFSKKKVVKEAL